MAEEAKQASYILLRLRLLWPETIKNNKVHFGNLKFHPDELASQLDDPTSRLGVLEKAHTSYCCAYLFLLHWRRSSGALYFLGLPVVN